jgi:DNA-directed RNA polymerase specialized sigma24 family protein
MNAKETNDQDSDFPGDNKPTPLYQPIILLSDEMSWEQFVNRYLPPVYLAISKLAGLGDSPKLDQLTAETLNFLWGCRQDLAKEKRPGVFIYKTMLQEVFAYLKKEGKEERIQLLRNIIPVDPACYINILEPSPSPVVQKKSNGFISKKIKRIWKTF